MRKAIARSVAALTSAGALAALLTTIVAQATPPEERPVASAPADARPAPPRDDAPLSPHERERLALRRQALAKVTTDGLGNGAGRGVPETVKVGGRYVELAQQRKAKLFVILAEFGDQVDTDAKADGKPKYGGTAGPHHNAIEPPRADAKPTRWQKDFSRAYYQKLLFGTEKGADTLRNYYRIQSSGRYDMDGTVSDWVELPHNEARYGANNCESNCYQDQWLMVRDATKAWYDSERAKGHDDAEIKAELAPYDVYDRYDFDKDNNFDEPDGYLDHLMVVHAGRDETIGGGAQGTDAIWAHQGNAYDVDTAGVNGPSLNRNGGTPLGDTGMWANVYVTGGEDSGVGLFAHEYGHDLGLPDMYSVGGESNGVDYWSLMAQASYLASGPNAPRDSPGDLDPWSKYQLGWLKHERVKAGSSSKHTLGVSGYNTDDPQAVIVDLPPSRKTTELTAPFDGDKQWWSGSGDLMDNSLTRSVDLRATPTSAKAFLEARVWYDTEGNYDFLTVEASSDGGKQWTALPGTIDGTALQPNLRKLPAVSGASKAWKLLHIPLDDHVGKEIQLRFHVTSDKATHEERGVRLDAVKIAAGAEIFSDGAEHGMAGWTAQGFTISTGSEGITVSQRAYFVENRRYVGYGAFLRRGTYFWGLPRYGPVGSSAKGSEQFFPYQEGALIWLWDSAYTDNATKKHEGHGLLLPVDARPEPILDKTQKPVDALVQPFDAPFSRHRSDGLNFGTFVVPSRPGVPAFDDHTGVYWDMKNPQLGVKVPDTNTRITVEREAENGRRTTISVQPSVTAIPR
ncbi:immune inhibitor A [Streptomyces sp. NBC_01210]|uniref:immune inhibitor A domain-containing protein n=1 Tax=Streptomyces sp. NBC_01210 TaxID=2903774 RepID=UPI002E14B8DB|nr:immune inhibitor A [Streptomyces sp. NBC_01210]